MKSYVCYEDFGAVGDGVTNDFFAIVKAHAYANENHLPVKTDGTKTYYIKDTLIDGVPGTISIKTNTDFGESNFIIDDTDFHSLDGTKISSADVFTVESDYPMETVTDREILSRLDGIGEGTKKIDLSLGYPAMLFVYNENENAYGRSGASFKASAQGKGAQKHELIVVDAEGNVDESTPFTFDYKEVTRLDIIRCDIEHITIEGGIFTTKASRHGGKYVDENGVTRKYGYVHRGFAVKRSFTTVRNVKHYVTGEVTTVEHTQGMLGAHYHGFFAPRMANEVTLENCVLTGRRYYKVSGTYDFSADHVNKIRLVNCTQSNFYMKNEEGETVYSMAISPLTGTRYCWGIGGTNFCKNMEYIGCTLSRFDAHRGLHNGKIVDTKINFIALTGKGKMLIENVEWLAVDKGRTNNSFIYLRGDYGSHWDGEIEIKNVRAVANDESFFFMFHSYSNFVYGYKATYPSLLIDNFHLASHPDGYAIKVSDENSSVLKEPNLHKDTVINVPMVLEDETLDYKNYNPVRPPEYLKVKTNPHGYSYVISDSDFFANTECEGITVIEKEKYND